MVLKLIQEIDKINYQALISFKLDPMIFISNSRLNIRFNSIQDLEDMCRFIDLHLNDRSYFSIYIDNKLIFNNKNGNICKRFDKYIFYKNFLNISFKNRIVV